MQANNNNTTAVVDWGAELFGWLAAVCGLQQWAPEYSTSRCINNDDTGGNNSTTMAGKHRGGGGAAKGAEMGGGGGDKTTQSWLAIKKV